MSLKTKLEDALGKCSSLACIIHLSAEGLANSRDMRALQMVADLISDGLEEARCIVDDMREDADG